MMETHNAVTATTGARQGRGRHGDHANQHANGQANVHGGGGGECVRSPPSLQSVFKCIEYIALYQSINYYNYY